LIWLSSVGIAFFITISVAFPAQTLQYPKWFWGTLLANYVACVAALHFIKIPSEVMISMGLFSVVMGIILLLVRKKLKDFEKKSEDS